MRKSLQKAFQPLEIGLGLEMEAIFFSMQGPSSKASGLRIEFQARESISPLCVAQQIQIQPERVGSSP